MFETCPIKRITSLLKGFFYSVATIFLSQILSRVLAGHLRVLLRTRINHGCKQWVLHMKISLLSSATCACLCRIRRVIYLRCAHRQQLDRSEQLRIQGQAALSGIKHEFEALTTELLAETQGRGNGDGGAGSPHLIAHPAAAQQRTVSGARHAEVCETKIALSHVQQPSYSNPRLTARPIEGQLLTGSGQLHNCAAAVQSICE